MLHNKKSPQTIKKDEYEDKLTSLTLIANNSEIYANVTKPTNMIKLN